MKYKIFVDGQEGTTGLMIRERLAARSMELDDFEIMSIDPEKKKDASERAKYLNAADVVFLCLPDAAAVEAAGLITNENTRVIDASTAHRISAGWAYGLPELSARHRERIAAGKRVSVPGCFATGFVALIYPLIAEGLLPRDYPVCCHSVTGYSGGGRKLIETFEAEGRDAALSSPCLYGLGLTHKHLPEMTAVTGLNNPPLFSPIIGDFYKGMTVAVPLHIEQAGLTFTADSLRDFYSDYYHGQRFVKVMLGMEDAGLINGVYLPATGCNGANRMELFVFGTDAQAIAVARLDNLGKGSSGAAIQCMNIMTGVDERLGLSV